VIWPVLWAFAIAGLLGFLAILVVTGRAVVDNARPDVTAAASQITGGMSQHL
jgi:hypothetical protein